MNIVKLIGTCGLVVGLQGSFLVAASVGDNVAPETKETALELKDSKDQSKIDSNITWDKSKELTYCKTFGWTIGSQSGLPSLGLTEKEIDAVIEGITAAARGEEVAYFPRSDTMQAVQDFLANKAEQHAKVSEKQVKEVAEKNKKAGEEYLANLIKTDSSVKKTASNLHYKIIKQGDDARPSDLDKVKIRYKIHLVRDGKIVPGEGGLGFESQGFKKPFEGVTHPMQGLFEGLKEGIKLIGCGGEVDLYVPSSLAYGDYDMPIIRAGSTLYCKLHLLSIEKAEAPKQEPLEKAEGEKKILEKESELPELPERAQPANDTKIPAESDKG